MLAGHKNLTSFLQTRLFLLISSSDDDTLKCGLSIPRISVLLCPLCSPKMRFCRALKQEPARDSLQNLPFSNFSIAIKRRNTTQQHGFRVLKATKNSLCCANPKNPREEPKQPAGTAKIFHRWMQGQGGWGPQQTRGKTLKTAQKSNFEMQKAAALKSGPGATRKGGMQTGITAPNTFLCMQQSPREQCLECK